MPDDLFALSWSDESAPVVLAEVVLLVVLGIVVRFVLMRLVRRVERDFTVGPAAGSRLFGSKKIAEAAVRATSTWRRERQAQRTAALGSLVRSIITVAVAAVTVLAVLKALGLNVLPVLASASVLGVVIGFGAQNLVKDLLSGTAMLLEDQFGVGDVIDMQLATGTVEAVGLRVTRLRDSAGMIWYVRNGEVVRLGNRSQGWSQIMLDVQIAYDQDVEHAQAVLEAVVAEVSKEEQFAAKIVDMPSVVGIEQVTGSAVTFRVVGTCAPNENFAIQREIRLRLKVAFDAAGISPPAPVPAWGTGAGVPPGPMAGPAARP